MCVAVMIPISLSPVAYTIISSVGGKTIRVEKRSFARTGITSCWEYFTVLAPPESATAGVTPSHMRQTVARIKLHLETHLAFKKLLIFFLLNWIGSLLRFRTPPEP